MTFPSPSRGSYFSIIHYRIVRCWWIFVSVPFLGILFLNVCADVASAVKLISFRPLPGDLISQFTYEYLGEHLGNSFRPLPGDLISQSLYWIHGSYISKAKFPSPSRGILFLNDIECNCEDREDAVSVPFPGILFLNLTDVDGQLGVISFPSPSRGSYFSILSFTCLILTGFQSRIAVQNQIRLWNKLLSP